MAARKQAESKPVEEPVEDQETVEEGTAADEAQVSSAVDKENAQGFRGTEVDPTDNFAYTVQGVGAGMPTPETDADAALDVAGPQITKFNNKQ